MDRLEKIIQSNRDQFNDKEPHDGHFDRFQHKLEQYHRQKRSFPWTTILKAAAIAVLVVLSGLWVYDNTRPAETSQKLALEKVSPEVKEAHIYYTSLMQRKYERIRQFDFKNEEQKEMLDELKNKKAKETGKEPSYSDILDEVFEGSEVKEKREKERDFLEIF